MNHLSMLIILNSKNFNLNKKKCTQTSVVIEYTFSFYNELTISLNTLPLAIKLGNISKEAHAGDNVTISPDLAIFFATSTASSREETVFISTFIPFSFSSLSKTNLILSLVFPKSINVFI